MKILVTGAGGFVGRNLVESLKNIRDGKDRVHAIQIDEIYEFHKDDSASLFERYCQDCDFVFHLAGVNRPEKAADFWDGNMATTEALLLTLQNADNFCPVMLASSAQASLMDEYADSIYGKSKQAAEELVFHYAHETGAPVYVYRFPNLFGKWSKPNYNSVVATFCHNIANDLPIRLEDENRELALTYIDDVVEEMLLALQGKPHRCAYKGKTPIGQGDGSFCYVPTVHYVTVDYIAKKLQEYYEQPLTCLMPEIPDGSFEKKLFSTYLSYLPAEKTKVALDAKQDERGQFTEIFKMTNGGQFSVSVNKPGITRGEHWHHSKWEIFIVVSGHGLIQERKLDSDEVIEHEVSGDKPEAVYLLPGYAHNLINLSDTEDLVTLIWANEEFDPNKPDTYRERVNKPDGI